jgi:methenyltetrahydrofolate cyclohydrolase
MSREPNETSYQRTLHSYVQATASASSTPGGGSVAAVVGALAAALGEMVANLTLGRERFAGAEAALLPVRDRLTQLRQNLLAAADADEAAYAAYRRAASLPRGTEAEKSARAAAMREALIASTEVPLDIARSAAEVAQILETVARDGNPRLRSDAALGALLAEVALRGALLNVRGNAAHLRDSARVQLFLSEAARLEEAGRTAADTAFRVATD